MKSEFQRLRAYFFDNPPQPPTSHSLAPLMKAQQGTSKRLLSNGAKRVLVCSKLTAQR